MRLLDISGTKAGRKTLKSTASVLGLVAGAIGWSGLAQAASDESGLQTLLLPDHYRLLDDGVVVFQLEGGEELSLNPDQYLILEDGLLLITDELAQASMETLPGMGAIRSQLMSDVQPIRSPDGSVVQASDASPLWSGDGPAPRLLEEVDIQRYELAQNSSETQTQPEPNLGQAAGAAAGGLSLAGLSLLSSIPGTNPEQETEETTEAASASAPAPAPTGEFLSNTMFQALTPASAKVFTGSSDNSFIGYTAADSSAADSLMQPGYGAGNSASFDMRAGGDNTLTASYGAAASSGAFYYTGGSGKDDLVFGDGIGMSVGSVNVNAGNGDNTLTVGHNAAGIGGSLVYTGGSGKDDLVFGDGIGRSNGTVTLNASNGDNTLTVGHGAATSGGSLVYTGGTGLDVLTFGFSLAANGGTVQLDLGNDSSDDAIEFLGSVADAAASESKYVQIINYDVTNDRGQCTYSQS
jgi:hypothetical protein